MSRVIKFKVYIGYILFYGFARYLPKPNCIIKPIGLVSKKIRSFCGHLMLESCGKNVNICNLSIFSTKVKLWNNSGIGVRANISGPCTIGNNVIMGPEVYVFTKNHNISRTDIPIKYQGDTDEREVFIGDDCWIGCRAIILPGVKIGKGVVIGAGAVVSKDIPDFSVVVGNPGRIIRTRGEEKKLDTM